MNKRVLAAAPLIAALLLGGCGGSDPNKIQYGLITGPSGVSGDALTAVSSGMTAVSTENGTRTQTYMAAGESADDYKTVFAQAAEEGVDYVLCVGPEMEIPVYEAQSANKKSKYILFDGEPRKSADAGSLIKDNTMCITFDEASMGFLAGGAAVREGLRNIVFMTGTETSEDSAQYLAGFINGIGYECSALNVDASTVTVGVEYAGTEAISPMRMTDASRLFAGGTELIVTDIPAFLKAFTLAAQDGNKLGTVGFNATENASVLFSATADLEKSTAWVLKEAGKKKGFKGGETLKAGAAQNGIRFVSSYTNMSVLTTTDVENILTAMSDGTAVAFDESAGATETAAGSLKGLFDFGKAVNVVRVEPTAPQNDGTEASAETATAAADSGAEAAEN
ncbi:MAG: BMP family ABC transporter substrate-binding protein [Lachnospiraceae bacterium]|nr:BMP family ABC transporter substrate-binding protein [Lachnospiraceae bacterium]